MYNTGHILSFVIFVELLVVEVHHLEILIGRLSGRFPEGSPARPWNLGASQYMPHKKQLLGCRPINDENDKKESIARFCISNFRDYSPALWGRA